jgi:hypothetical protein
MIYLCPAPYGAVWMPKLPLSIGLSVNIENFKELLCASLKPNREQTIPLGPARVILPAARYAVFPLSIYQQVLPKPRFRATVIMHEPPGASMQRGPVGQRQLHYLLCGRGKHVVTRSGAARYREGQQDK